MINQWSVDLLIMEKLLQKLDLIFTRTKKIIYILNIENDLMPEPVTLQNILKPVFI